MTAHIIVRIVPNGGAGTAQRVKNQLDYLSRQSAVKLWRSGRHQDVVLPYEQLEEFSRQRAEQTGNYNPCQSDAESTQDLTPRWLKISRRHRILIYTLCTPSRRRGA